MIAGGYTEPYGGCTSSVDFLNPTTNSLSPYLLMRQFRDHFQMVLLPNSNVLIAGGFYGSSDIADCEVSIEIL